MTQTRTSTHVSGFRHYNLPGPRANATSGSTPQVRTWVGTPTTDREAPDEGRPTSKRAFQESQTAARATLAFFHIIVCLFVRTRVRTWATPLDRWTL